MQAPQIPVDIKIIFGSPQGCQNLVNISSYITDSEQKINEIIKQRKIAQQYLNDYVIITDIYTQKGKQQKAMEFFSNQQQKSPLKIMYNFRPQLSEEFWEFTIQKYQGYVRVINRYKIDEYPNQIRQSLQMLQENEVGIQANLTSNLKGSISYSKANHMGIKIDYAEISLASRKFVGQSLFNSLLVSEDIQQQLQDIKIIPWLNLLKKSKSIKMHLKYQSLRKINRFYQDVCEESAQKENKSVKYTNKYIFKEKVNTVILFKNMYIVSSICKYKNQDVLMRFIKVNAKLMEKVLQTKIYFDD